VGADYFAYKVNFNNRSILAGTNDIYNQRYATVPVRLLYLSNSKRRVGFYAAGGIDFSIFISANDLENDFLSSYYNNILVSSYISCGVVLRSRNATDIWMLGPFYTNSINNMYSQQRIVWKDEVLLATGNNGNFTTMGLTLSFITNFRKWRTNDN
jgi:hypothetical protein